MRSEGLYDTDALTRLTRESLREGKRHQTAIVVDWWEWRGLRSHNAEGVLFTGHIGPSRNTGATSRDQEGP